MHHHDQGSADHADDRDVPDEIEIEVVIERRVDGGGRVGPEQRIAVGRRAHDRIGRDVAGGARPVLDDELLAEPLGERLTEQTHEDVGAAAGRIADDAAHRPGRIGLRPRKTRHGWERSSARRQLQKSSAWKLHDVPL